MAMCIIGKSGVFSDAYLNLGAAGYDAEQIRFKVSALLKGEYPELEWFPETGEMGVECDSLREAKAKYPVSEIAAFMVTAYREIIADESPIRDADPMLDRFVGRISIRRLREQKRLSQRQLAEQTGIQLNVIQSIEFGDIPTWKLREDDVERFCKVLECKPEDFMYC